jgi:hypothetical protein
VLTQNSLLRSDQGHWRWLRSQGYLHQDPRTRQGHRLRLDRQHLQRLHQLHRPRPQGRHLLDCAMRSVDEPATLLYSSSTFFIERRYHFSLHTSQYIPPASSGFATFHTCSHLLCDSYSVPPCRLVIQLCRLSLFDSYQLASIKSTSLKRPILQ